jgi:predicted nucleic acid-binding protein
MILLDTDVTVDILRRYPPAVAWAETAGDDRIVLPGLVVMELVDGCTDGEALARLRRGIRKHRVIWPSWKACGEALDDLVAFRLSHGLGIIDALVGRTAVDLGVPLHTFNERHYRIIPGLQTVQPYQR